MRPHGPYPILYYCGEHGAAKSTASRVTRRIIDPYKAEIRSAPRDERDLCIAARSSHIVALDNISRLDDWLSDAMCRLATGGGQATRELYTDVDEVIFEAQRPQLLNGIEQCARRADFVDRCIFIELPTISESARRDEKTFWSEFSAAWPEILGAVLDGASAVLRNLDSIIMTEKPRMADFALCAAASEETLGFSSGSFMHAYSNKRGQAHDLVIEASPIANYLLAEIVPGNPGPSEWTGTMAGLLARLNNEAGNIEKRPKSWPSTPEGLAGELKRLAPSLRQCGLDYRRDGRGSGKKRERLITLRRLPERLSDLS